MTQQIMTNNAFLTTENMKKFLILCVVLTMMCAGRVHASDNLIHTKSMYSHDETVDRFANIVIEKGFTLFNKIDHTSNGSKVGLDIPPTTVIVFGNPKVGTQLMQCSQTFAIELPQKMLIWQNDNKQVFLTYKNPESFKELYAVNGCDPVFKKIAGALAKLTSAAAEK